MDSVQQTGKGLEWLIYQMFGLHPDREAFTTVNERLEIFQTATPTQAERAKLGVLIAGNRGHGCSPGVNGVSRTTRNLHRATDTGLFNLLPFSARPVDDPLTEQERSRYCLFKRETHGGILMDVCYGLRMNVNRNDLAISKELVTKVPGQPEEREVWVPNADNLRPQPVEIPNQGAVTASYTTLDVRGLLRVVLTESIIAEFIEAIKVIYDGDETYGTLSEFGLCCGVDRIVEIPGAGGVINVNESIATTIYSFANDHKTVYMNTQSLELDFDVGNGIPLFAVESIPTLETVP